MGAGNLESDNFPIPDHNQVTIIFVYLTFIFSIPVIVINLFGGVSNYEIKNMKLSLNQKSENRNEEENSNESVRSSLLKNKRIAFL
ncbi:hypothetical protein BpHYR1_033511 [Brachionus plicatilis]|uniref:Uncharacterized protein n=1 Tax=Brachionus plicatilis TaxID=10195 RepID=A0A3M7QWK6_BRAPC|nr:hypothetical protein BpHYR1_033511 [Brachionus plicatilis]